MPERYIYADFAATAPVSESVLREMLPYFGECCGNPSSLHKAGRRARTAVETARERIAAVFSCLPGEIIFTSGGTEADNQALRGACALSAKDGKRHIITTAVEHHAVLECCGYLEKQGFEVTYLSPDETGLVTSAQVEAALRQDTGLVSVMLANNEIGTVMPADEIGALCRERGVLFHTDAVQAAGNIPIDLSKLRFDMMSVSGHKAGAPKGTGFLYVRNGIDIPPLIFGGGQEKGRRSGTENVPGIAGLARAAQDACRDIPEKAGRLSRIRDRIIDGVLCAVPDSRLNGSRENRLCGNINFSFKGVESESLVIMLDLCGISASGGSACAGSSGKASHVLTAIGLSGEEARGSLRLSLGEPITDEDGDYIIRTVSQTVEKLRKG